MVACMGRPGSRSGDRGGYLGSRSPSHECRRESFVFSFVAETGSAATEESAATKHTAATDRAGCATGDSRNTDAARPCTGG